SLEGEIVGAYSPELPVWSGTLSQWQTHPALDIAGTPGEAVYACRDGVVSDAWHDRLWGNVIVIDHADGYQSTYAGLNTLNLAEVGQAVAAGDVISAVGPSLPCEADQPAHIHFQLTWNGEPADFEALVKQGA
ncbi:MAG: M23 family metallopeptidase, partial [Clostridia bacterium]|nr:M23 family metallopeptidase [Clostridia bacterium]